MTATTLADRAVLRLSGEDVRGFLQGLVTSDMAGPLPAWTALLTAQGKALFDFLVWSGEAGGESESLLIDCEAAQADALARRLALYRLRRRIAIERDASLAVHWSPDGDTGTPDPRLAALGRRWIAAPGAGTAEPGWRARRLLLGVTEGMAELGSDANLWLECNAAELNGVSFTKGCYVGQENTARMNWRQKVNRRLVVLRVDRDPGDAASVWYETAGLAVARLRVPDIATLGRLGSARAQAIVPPWLAAALTL